MNGILAYLSDLERHNNREWYHENKARYQLANAGFERFLEKLILAVGEFDGSVVHHAPRALTFKLARDTRFSHDKSPYNPAFRAHIAAKGKLPIPVGYYVQIVPGNHSFLGGGLFAPVFRDATEMVRNYISAHGDAFGTIVSDKDFAEHFAVKGEALKNVPSGYDKDHPQAEYLKNKNWFLEYPVSDEMLVDAESFAAAAARIFQLMKPFNDFLNKALTDFKMPVR